MSDLAAWSAIPGSNGEGDMTAAREAMAASPYATGNRCTDTVCGGVAIVMSDTLQPTAPEFEDRLRDLGIDAEITIDPDPYACLDPLQPIAMCIGMGWSPDGRVMYHTESFRYAIFAFDFDPGSGEIAGRHLALRDGLVGRHEPA